MRKHKRPAKKKKFTYVKSKRSRGLQLESNRFNSAKTIRKEPIDIEIGLTENDLYDVLQYRPDGCQRRLYLAKTESRMITKPEFMREIWRNKFLCMNYYGMPRKRGSGIRLSAHDYRSKEFPHLISRHPATDKGVPTLLDLLTDDQYLAYKAEGPDNLLGAKMQFEIYVTGKPMAEFVGMTVPEKTTEMPDFYVVHMTRDNSVIEPLIRKATSFWEHVVLREPPKKFPKDSRQCLFCEWHRECHGGRKPSHLRRLDGHVKRYIQLGEVIERAERSREQTEKRIVAALETTDGETYYGKVKVETKLQTVLSAGKLLRDHPELKERYTESRPVRRITVTPLADAYTASPASPGPEEPAGQTEEQKPASSEQPEPPHPSLDAPC